MLSFGRGASKSPGRYKQEQNYVGERGSREMGFVPIAPEQLAAGMAGLFQMIGDTDMPILLRTAWHMRSSKHCTHSRMEMGGSAGC